MGLCFRNTTPVTVRTESSISGGPETFYEAIAVMKEK